MTTTTKPKLFECVEPHVCLLQSDRGYTEYAFRLGDELPDDHAAVLAHPDYWRPVGTPAAGTPVAPAPEPEPEPELAEGAVRMRTRASRKAETMRVSYTAPDGSQRVAGPNQVIETSEQGAENLQVIDAAKPV